MNVPALDRSDYLVKICSFGMKETGKTNILSRLCYDDFTGAYHETIGIDFYVYNFTQAQKKLRVQFWDVEVTIKSQSEQMKQLCCKGCIGLLFIYSIVDSSSFEYVEKLIVQLKKKSALSSNICGVLVGNKADLQQDRKVSSESGQNLAQSHGLFFIETSAKDGVGIKQLGHRIGADVLRIIQQAQMNS